MLLQLFQGFQKTIGSDTFSFILFLQMCIRGMLIYIVGIIVARYNKKLMGIRTPFNFTLFIMLGSIFATAVIDAEYFIPIIGTIFFLTFLNNAMTRLAFNIPLVELIIKGQPDVIVKNGRIQYHAMRKNFITKRELLDELNTQLHTHDFKKIESATLASDGSINFIHKKT